MKQVRFTRTELFAIELREAGLNTNEIAAALGWTRSEVSGAYSKALQFLWSLK
jgi:transcriptional regulator